MNKLISKDKRISLYTRRKISKAIIAAIIAIIIMFTGLISISASRGSNIEIIEKIYSGYTQVILSENSDESPQTIETEYTITNVPNGFTLWKYNADDTIINAIWNNDIGEEILFQQNILYMDFSMDNENYYEEIHINGYPAYIYGEDLRTIISWTDGEYWFTICAPIQYKNEIISMAENISKKS